MSQYDRIVKDFKEQPGLVKDQQVYYATGTDGKKYFYGKFKLKNARVYGERGGWKVFDDKTKKFKNATKIDTVFTPDTKFYSVVTRDGKKVVQEEAVKIKRTGKPDYTPALMG